MMNLLTRQSYLFQFENANSSVNLSYYGVVCDIAPGDYIIIHHNVDYMPDRVYTLSVFTVTAMSTTPLSASSNNGDWHYDNTTHIFSYIVKNPSSNTASMDVSANLNVIKCRYPNCQPPIQPGLALPVTARPANALYWSNDSHWSFASAGGVKPGDNTDIYIPYGVWLVVDYSLPCILSLRIDGVLEFEQGMNNTLYVDSILINGGQLIVGWPNNPLRSYVDIIITGSSSVNVLLPNSAGTIGPRVNSVLGGLDLHGIPHNVSWTRLAITASAGQTSITLMEPVDWVIGDEVILTTTATRIGHVERHTIVGISGSRTVITLARALTYDHIVIDHVFPNGEVYHVAGAVGLLTRNIRVINRSPASELFGFRIIVTDYATNIWDPLGAAYLYTYYKGYARLSDAQFIGFGQFVDAPNEDKREGIHLYNLGDWNASRPTYIDSCSFNTGYYSAIDVWDTNGVPITRNVIYNTYESALVVTGQNNIVNNNLVSTIYWSSEAQPQYAQFNANNDGPVMPKDATSVVMRNNLVAGVQRQAYRIQGNSCPGTVLPAGINNDYDNNEAHSVMACVNMWPLDTSFPYDTTLTHEFSNNSIIIRNSLVIGAITPNDCNDVPDMTTLSEFYSSRAIPLVSATAHSENLAGRAGITFPYFSGNNLIPAHPYTSIAVYPNIDGLMSITNVTLAFYNDICSRRDIAIQVSQNNDDGQHPIVTDHMSVYNTSYSSVIFNGRPNLDRVNPSDCVDMDCDGLKKALLTDTDGTLFGQPSSVFSQVEYLWGDQAHGVDDYRIPSVALASMNGTMININNTYPYRGTSRALTCTYQPLYQMYLCRNTTDYCMLIIESMDPDTETRRLSPIAIMSDNGFIDLINGPQDHGWCNGYTCQKRISTFMAIVEARHHYEIYLTSTTPNHIRFRLLNADSLIRTLLALYYNSLQQIDVYANGVYVSPTNRNPNSSYLMLLDQPSGITYASPAGSNFFNRTTQMASFIIDGLTVIDLKISELIVLTFGLPPTTPSAFFTTNLVGNLAALLNVTPDKIRHVRIVSANNETRIRRQVTLLSRINLRVEIRNEPPATLSGTNNNASSNTIWNTTADIINRYQSGQLQLAWAADPVLNATGLLSLSIQEPGNQTTVSLSVINRIVLIVPPSSCRLQSVCDIQPIIVAFDPSGNIIDKLDSNDQPWQVVAFVVGSSNVSAIGAIANYSNGQTQFTTFGVTGLDSYQIGFAFITPNGVDNSTFLSINLTADASSVSVSSPILSVMQYINVDVVSINETFNLTTLIVDKISKTKIGNIQWGNSNWSATASLYTSLQYQSNGSLLATASSSVIVDTTKSTISVTNLAISEIGIIVVLDTVGSTASAVTALSRAANILTTTGVGAVSGLRVSSVNINGQFYSVSSASNTSDEGNNIGLIIGLVVGLVGGAIIIIGLVFGFYRYHKKHKGQPLLNEMDEVTPVPIQSEHNCQNTVQPSKSLNDKSRSTQPKSVKPQNTLNSTAHRLHSPLPEHINEKRPPSGALSATGLNATMPNHQPSTIDSLPAVELIRFD
ncbi:unnamed protein product [Rotaria sp. Silwood2]|nr:unnamed protein product [Rotaria sp. Silwood2]CAF3031720.1 unnamed protein product [Rotaria sp. Silwood2]CAF4199750.1 unnamed protein product [Rotaria sp. Silwood2]